MGFSRRWLAIPSAVVLLSSAGLLLSTSPASALPTRQAGPFLTNSAVGSTVVNTWDVFVAGQPITLQKGVNDLPSAAVISIPNPGSTGVIQGTGAAADLCITAPLTPVNFAPTTAETCNGSAQQQWFITTDGQMLFAGDQTFGLSDYTANNSVRMVGGPSGPQAWDAIILSNLSPVVAPLTADVTSHNDADRSAVVGGTGEPGATIEIATPGGTVTTIVDPDGNWTANIPSLNVGSNTLGVTQQIGGVTFGTATLVVTIAAPPATPTPTPTPTSPAVVPGPALADTGVNLAPAGSLALVLLVAGAGVLAMSRRRKRAGGRPQ